MKKYLVTFLIPAAVVDAWSTTDPVVRDKSESAMREEWGAWMAAHAGALGEMTVGGKTKRVTAAGPADIRNDIILYVVAEAESHDAAVRLFENHPHLQIPQSSIEIMETRPMTGG
jgi:hypothetical protein